MRIPHALFHDNSSQARQFREYVTSWDNDESGRRIRRPDRKHCRARSGPKKPSPPLQSPLQHGNSRLYLIKQMDDEDVVISPESPNIQLDVGSTDSFEVPLISQVDAPATGSGARFLTAPQLMMMTFFCTTGGPFGIERFVKKLLFEKDFNSFVLVFRSQRKILFFHSFFLKNSQKYFYSCFSPDFFFFSALFFPIFFLFSDIFSFLFFLSFALQW